MILGVGDSKDEKEKPPFLVGRYMIKEIRTLWE